jgi:hypothetical protein
MYRTPQMSLPSFAIDNAGTALQLLDRTIEEWQAQVGTDSSRASSHSHFKLDNYGK